MNEITVKRINPRELSKVQIFRLNYLHKTELGEFVVLYDHKKRELLVNKAVPEDDIQRFCNVILYDNDYLLDDELGCTDADYIYEKYGFSVYNLLFEAWGSVRRDLHMKQAEAAAPILVKAIDAVRMADGAPNVFDEFLAYQVSSMAEEKKQKTAQNMVSLGTEYVFYMGYLMGVGSIKGGIRQDE